MKNYGNQILGIIVVFFTTLFLNASLEAFFSKSGTVEVINMETPSGGKVAHILVENHSTKSINGLKLVIPRSTEISTISASYPLELEEGKNALAHEESKLVEISSIPPRSRTTMLVPFGLGESCCAIANLDEVSLYNKSGMEVTSQTRKALFQGVQTATIYTVFFAIFIIYQKMKINELKEEIDKVVSKKDSLEENVNKELREMKERSKEMKLLLARQKAILQRRLSDYVKELEFWRNTIRKVLYVKFTTKVEVDGFLTEVTRMLETYGTREKSEDIETIQALAVQFSNYEQFVDGDK